MKLWVFPVAVSFLLISCSDTLKTPLATDEGGEAADIQEVSRLNSTQTMGNDVNLMMTPAPANLWGYVWCPGGQQGKPNVEVHIEGQFYFSWPPPGQWKDTTIVRYTDQNGAYSTCDPYEGCPAICWSGLMPECSDNFFTVSVPRFGLEQNIYAEESTPEVDFHLQFCISSKLITSIPY